MDSWGRIARLEAYEMVVAAIWKGTEEEATILIRILDANCQCAKTASNRRCGVHSMLLNQKTIDDLLFMRRIANRLKKEEFRVKPRE